MSFCENEIWVTLRRHFVPWLTSLSTKLLLRGKYYVENFTNVKHKLRVTAIREMKAVSTHGLAVANTLTKRNCGTVSVPQPSNRKREKVKANVFCACNVQYPRKLELATYTTSLSTLSNSPIPTEILCKH